MKKIAISYKHLIIGFGKGGKTLAAYLANQGQEVALIEKSDKMYGGSCINIACIPSKSLIINGEKGRSYIDSFRIKNALTSFLRVKNFEHIAGLDLATVITGEASFVSAHEVIVKQGGDSEDLHIRADHIYINTGSLPFIPAISGVDSSNKVFTSTSLMEQSDRPDKLVIIGGGYVGLEFADMYSKFGTLVTLLNDKKEFLQHEDRDMAAEILKVLTGKGIEIVNGINIDGIRDLDERQVEVSYINERNKPMHVVGNAVLLATGRKPNIESLNVSAAGIKLNKKGYIEVDDFLKTSQPHIWAIGDINGGPQFTYISLDDFRIIKDQLFDNKIRTQSNRNEVAFSVFTSPSFSHIGLREWEAIGKGYRIKVAKLPATAIPKARILRETNGLLKAIVDIETNKILGCSLFCVDSNEMINTVQVAMNAGLEFQVLRDAIYTHPSMTEALNDLLSQI